MILQNTQSNDTVCHDSDDEENPETNKQIKKPLSWSAFHSVTSNGNVILSNVAIVAPLYRRSPTEIPMLMDILKKAMKISVLAVGEGKRAIITLDGDLYGRAVKLHNYKSRYIIRLGSLHTVIAALKCLGKYIHGSGVDAAWEVSGLYGSATINQITDGRHIYRGIQAHTTTLIALTHLKIQSDLYTEEEKKELQSKMTNIEHSTNTDGDKDFKICIENLQKDFESNGVYKKLHMNVPLRETAKFLDIYTTQIMNMLTYIGATRSKNWLQHLATTNDMYKYFHAHDLPNYSKWAPLYLADMMELESSDNESWQFLSEGNFTVTTNPVPFTSIDPDHAIEHQHKAIKSGKGIADIKDNESALERFALTIPILSKVTDEFRRCVFSFKSNFFRPVRSRS